MSDTHQPNESLARRFAPRLLVFAGYGLASVALTWPMVASLGDAIASHPDYFSNLWNIWWVRKSLFELGVLPYWTDFLFFPHGIWLTTHTLSLANSVPGALIAPAVGPTAAFNLLTLAHFWLSGWACYLLANHLTANRAGSFLAGLVYSFCPFHFYYLPMINIASMEALPLAALFFMKTYRSGGMGNAIGACAAMLLAATSSWYYLPYVGLLVAGLTACGRLWAPEVPVRLGVRRVARTAIAGTIVLLPTVLPLLAATLSSGADAPMTSQHLNRGHDLLGFFWLGPPVARLLLWPVAVGYTALLLVGLGHREVWRQKTWLVLLGVSFVLGLGGSLHIAGVDTGIPLPDAFLTRLPILGMMRSPDRIFVILQLCFAVLCAYAWRDVSRRIAAPRLRTTVWVTLALLAALEYRAAPLARFPNPCSAYLAEMARDRESHALIDLPPSTLPWTGIYNRCQIVHGKQIAQGYVTRLALTPRLLREAAGWQRSFREIGSSGDLVRRVRERGFDLVVLHKQTPKRRPSPEGLGTLLWQPFSRLSSGLMPQRQAGGLELRAASYEGAEAALRSRLGEPVHEDDLLVIYRVP